MAYRGTHHVEYYNSHTQSYFKIHAHTYCGPCTRACMHTNILNCLRSSLPQHHCRRTQLRTHADALSSGRVQKHSALDMCQHMRTHAQRLIRACTCRNMECPGHMKIHTKLLIHAGTCRCTQRAFMPSSQYMATNKDTKSALGNTNSCIYTLILLYTEPFSVAGASFFDTCRHMNFHTLLLKMKAQADTRSAPRPIQVNTC